MVKSSKAMEDEILETLEKVYSFIKVNEGKNYMVVLLDRKVPNLGKLIHEIKTKKKNV